MEHSIFGAATIVSQKLCPLEAVGVHTWAPAGGGGARVGAPPPPPRKFLRSPTVHSGTCRLNVAM